MIVGRDLLQELGIVLHFADQTIVWGHASTSMKNYQPLESNDIVAMVSESPAVVKATERMKQILEAKYEQVDIKEMVTRCKHLSNTEQQQLFAVLSRFQSLFDGTLGHWKNELMI
jgi:DNA-binding transcriptional regulator YhcF (GntR family)